MTTEETELTFVRCSNCRSLIPAIATRCRMCGAQFEKKADSGDAQPIPEASNQNRQSRVRQRTISANADEVEQLKRDAFNPPAEEEAASPQPPSFRLGAGAPRRDTAPPSFPSESIRNFAVPVTEALADEEGIPEQAEIEEFDDSLATHHKQERDSFRFVDRVSEQDDDWNDENDTLGDETSLSEDEEEDLDLISDETPESSPARGEGRRKRRRRRRKRSQNAGGAEMGEQHSEPVRDEHSSGHHESFDRPEPQRVAAPAPREREQRQEVPRQETARAETRRGDSGGSGGELQAPKSDGKLVGWFVTFGENAQGESAEIRAGRFFLGRQKLRGNDYIIPHSSISTPHCMIVAGGGDALMIQDLMSEGGTQLKRAGESTYSPVSNAVSVHHGDWVRFGQYETMVCLLPKGRAS